MGYFIFKLNITSHSDV